MSRPRNEYPDELLERLRSGLHECQGMLRCNEIIYAFEKLKELSNEMDNYYFGLVKND